MLKNSPISKRTLIRRAIRMFMVGEDGIAGSALIEFTMFAPMLVVAAIYTMDFGLLLITRMEVQNAAQAGAQWAMTNRVYNPLDIEAAGKNATKILPSKITIKSYEFCGCPSLSGVTLLDSTPPPDPCSGPASNICSGLVSCSGGARAGNYVSVCARPTTAYQSFVAFGLFSVSPTVQATTTVRIQ